MLTMYDISNDRRALQQDTQAPVSHTPARTSQSAHISRRSRSPPLSAHSLGLSKATAYK